MPGTFYGKKKEDPMLLIDGMNGPVNGYDLAADENDPSLLQGSPNASDDFEMAEDFNETAEAQKIIGEKEIREAAAILEKYRTGKASLEARLKEDELWWELRHWEAIRRDKDKKDMTPEPTSAWLFNSIINKHADAMDNYPVPVVLPRERSDEESAKRLSGILPVIMEYNDFEKTYSDNWWEKLKHGTAAYMVTWNPEKENGVGDIEIAAVDLMSIYWEPGIQDIEKSANLFVVDLVDREALERQYPEYKDSFAGDLGWSKSTYLYDESIDTSEKCTVVDWYYKVKTNTGRTILHFVKFSGTAVLYASENDPAYRERGFYDHGRYPVVFDVMFPEKGTPAGFGYVAISKDPQMYIDKLSANIMQSSMMGTKKRFFISSSTNIKEDEFLDWNKQLVRVEGELNDTRIREIQVSPLPQVYQSVLQMKIEEMKETSANRDVSNGGTASGVSAAAAIAALQEAGNKVSRDMIQASYRSFTALIRLVIELIREFYDEKRSFRITGTEPGEYEFVEMSNLQIREQETGRNIAGEVLYRVPIFDLKIKAQKRNPFSRMEENERAKELYGMGFFNPERSQEALGALEMMDFEGIDKVREQVNQGATLLNIVRQQGEQLKQLQMMVAGLTGQGMQGMAPPQDQGDNAPGVARAAAGAPEKEENLSKGDRRSVASGIMEARTPMTSYGDRLAKRSAANMDVADEMNPLKR